MRPKKCDRCGKFFDVTDKENKYIVISKIKRYTRSMELCPECVSQLEKFIKGNFESEKSNTTEEDGGI